MMTLVSDARSAPPTPPPRPSTEGMKNNDIVSVSSKLTKDSSKLTKGTRLSTGNIEMTDAEYTKHLISKMESPKSAEFIVNTNSDDDGYTAIHDADELACTVPSCTDLTSLMALKMIESTSKGGSVATAAAATDKTIYSDAVTRHVKNGNPNPITIVEENQVSEANAFACGGGLSSILDDNAGVDGNKNVNEDNGSYGAKDEDDSIYITDKTVQSGDDDMSGPTAMMLHKADSCSMNDGITDIKDVIQSYSEAYTSAASCVGSAVTEAARGNSLAAIDEEMTMNEEEDDGTCMSDDRTETTKWTYDTRTTCVTEPAPGVANATQCRDDIEEEQVNNNESVLDSFSAILCCKGDDEGNDSTVASSIMAVNDDDRTYNDYSTAATYTTKATTAVQPLGAASTMSETNHWCMLPAWYTQDPTK